MQEKIIRIHLILVFYILAFNCFAQQQSPYLYGQNYWYKTEFPNVITKLKDANIRLVRIGGIEFDEAITNQEYITYIDKIREAGAEPLVQVRRHATSQEAYNLIQYINGTMGKNVKHWCIGNEPDWHWKITDPQVVANYFKPLATALKSYDPTIIIMGPDCAWWNPELLNGLIGGAADITGTDANGNYYLDVATYHNYNRNESGQIFDEMNQLLALVNNANTKRPANKKLSWGITEFNITTNNSHWNSDPRYQAFGFYAGQLIAEIFGFGLKNRAYTMMPWSVMESNGDRGIGDLGFYDKAPGYLARSTGWHEHLLSKKTKWNYLKGTSNQTSVRLVPTWDTSGFAIMILNENASSGYNYVVRFDNAAFVSGNALQIRLAQAGLAKEYTGSIAVNETQVVHFDASGNYTGRITYNKANSDALAGPSYAGTTPDKNATPLSAPNSDTQAPTAPSALNSPSKTSNSVSLAWTGSTDNIGVTGYDIYRGTILAGTSTATSFNVTGLTANTTYSFTVRAKDAAGNSSAPSNALSVTTNAAPAGTNLALNRTVTVSSSESTSLTGNYAVDGSGTTRWASTFADPSWIYVDLGSIASVNRVLFNWELAYATAFQVQVSTDASTWSNVYSTTIGDGGVDDITFTATSARYVRMYGTTRATVYGYSLWEFEVYGSIDTQAPSAPTNLTSPGKSSTTVDLSWTASTDNVGVAGYDIFRGTTLAGSSTGTSFQVTGLTASTTYNFTVKAKDAAGNVSVAGNALSVTTNAATSGTNLALNRPFTVSSTESATLSGAYAVDGNGTTRWSSAFTDPSWIYVDLGTAYSVNRVVLNWELAYASSYQVQVSNDASTWTNVYSTTSGNGGIDDISFTAASARYVRMNGTVRGTVYGYSLWEFEVYGNATTADTQAPTIPTNLSSPAKTTTTVDLTWTASTDNVGVTGYEVFNGTTYVGGPTTNSFQVTGLTANTTYSFTVKTKDAAGNVSAASSALSVTTNSATSTNKLSNGDFASGTSPWSLYVNVTNGGTLTNDAGTGKVTITNGGTALWQVQLQQNPAALTGGKLHTIRFTAKAASAKTITVQINNNGSWVWTSSNINLTTSYQTFTVSFTPSSNLTAPQFVINTGGNNIAAWYDNLQLVEGTATAKFELIQSAENDDAELSVYPNPASDILFIDYQSRVNQSIDVIVGNAVGTTVTQRKADVVKGSNMIRLQVSDYAEGLYFLKLQSPDRKTIVRKIRVIK